MPGNEFLPWQRNNSKNVKPIVLIGNPYVRNWNDYAINELTAHRVSNDGRMKDEG